MLAPLLICGGALGWEGARAGARGASCNTTADVYGVVDCTYLRLDTLSFKPYPYFPPTQTETTNSIELHLTANHLTSMDWIRRGNFRYGSRTTTVPTTMHMTYRGCHTIFN